MVVSANKVDLLKEEEITGKEVLERVGVGRPIQTTMRSCFMIHLTGKLRRYYLTHFRKGYVQRQLALRKGECHQCGRCCSFLFGCVMLTREGLCRTYETWRWEACKSFPINQKDIDEVSLNGGRCGYRFENTPGPPEKSAIHLVDSSSQP
jgi:hypothetical protein